MNSNLAKGKERRKNPALNGSECKSIQCSGLHREISCSSKEQVHKSIFFKKVFCCVCMCVCWGSTHTPHDHIWKTGSVPAYGHYVKPRADGDQQTGPSAHVGICHTYLSTCVIWGEKVSHSQLLSPSPHTVPYPFFFVKHWLKSAILSDFST